jgi:hypothetical protein
MLNQFMLDLTARKRISQKPQLPWMQSRRAKGAS